MTGPDPAEFGWWLASRAAGVVALLCISVSVGLGLAMAGRVSRRPALARTLIALHRQTALTGLFAIAVHGITLLGDRFLSPSVGDLVIPFTSRQEPLWTGLGVTGGWLAAILGLSYWIRHRIGAGRWRKLHRAAILVYVLSVAHTLGAGSDAAEPWMRVLLLGTGAPILFLFVMRVLTPATGPAFRRFRVAEVRPESSTVLSLDLLPADGKPPAEYEAGQFVTLRVDLPGGERELRSYSLSSGPRPAGYRISVKREPGGRVSEHLHAAVTAGDKLELTGPAGRFVIGETSEHPLVLISAGIGVTPVLAMLESSADRRRERPVWWIHGARSGAEHAFRSETQGHLARLRHGHSHVRYSRPQPRDRLGRDYDAAGRLSGSEILALGVPVDAEFRLCGPAQFVAEVTADLLANGARRERILSESFGGARAPRPTAPPTCPAAGDGPAIEFSRSGVTTVWDSDFTSLLEVAEAHHVPVASACRIGACHGCRAAVLTGSVRHDPEPVEPPPSGSALLCCAVPETDVVLEA
jgi:ferredoxin-NADP reductase/DMSO/TMAO reductase YedYZ heme-binding membrane subunit